MSQLRNKMTEDMILNGLAKKTQQNYLYSVSKLSKHFGKSPANISNEELREYFLFLKSKYAYSTSTVAICGIKFFYEKSLGKPFEVFNILRAPKRKTLPVVLSREEVHTLIKSVRSFRYRACLMLIYSCGLRVGEAVCLKANQIDGRRKTIHIRQAKGNKDRYVPLPEITLNILREYYRTHRNPEFIFPGGREAFISSSGHHVNAMTLQTVLKKALKETGIIKPASIHTLRHSYSTHLLESGVDIRIIQEYLGHKNIASTMIYTHLTPLIKEGVYSKVNNLMSGL